MESINLKQLINDYPECITNGAKLKAILLDTYPEISKAIVNTLVIMANSGIAKEIQDSANITELNKSRWQQKLEDEGFSEKVICSCLNMVFIAFGLNTACISNDEKLVVESSVSIQTKRALPPSNLSNFEIKDGVLVKYKGNSSVVVIPDGVISIGDFAFNYRDNLTSIVIPNGLTSIGYGAFSNCSGLTNILIPDSVNKIGDEAFANCCELTSVMWNAVDVTAGSFIGTIFEDCGKLSSISIGKNVKKIPSFAFSGCSGLTSIDVMEGNKQYYCEKNCLIETKTKRLILGCKNSVIPSDGSVTSIGDGAFSNCIGLTSIVIPDSVTSIGEDSFRNCSKLISIVIPDSVASIGDGVFLDCSELKSTVISNSITSISADAFCNCGKLASVVIPSSVMSIDYEAFYYCNELTSVTYLGLKKQWEKIEKGVDWNYRSITSVKCLDGIIKLK